MVNVKDATLSCDFFKLITGGEYDMKRGLKQIKYNSIPEVTKVIYDIPNNTTIVYFADGTKEIARVMDGDTYDKEVGVMQCIVKKMYGSRSKWFKSVVNKGIDVKPKKVKKITRNVANEFINGKIAVTFENPTEKEYFKAWIRSTTTLDMTYDSKDIINNCHYHHEAVHIQDGTLFYDDLEYLTSSGIYIVDYQWFAKQLKNEV